jgi:ribosome-associated heat shock protein Hsp15
MELQSIRADIFLWATRLFKTRSLAAQACRGGGISIDQHAIKPSRTLRVGEVLRVKGADLTRTVRIKALLEMRVGAALVSEYLEDLTPAAEYLRVEEDRRLQRLQVIQRPKGAGRPTKRDRRVMDDILQHGDESNLE